MDISLTIQDIKQNPVHEDENGHLNLIGDSLYFVVFEINLLEKEYDEFFANKDINIIINSPFLTENPGEGYVIRKINHCFRYGLREVFFIKPTSYILFVDGLSNLSLRMLFGHETVYSNRLTLKVNDKKISC